MTLVPIGTENNYPLLFNMSNNEIGYCTNTNNTNGLFATGNGLSFIGNSNNNFSQLGFHSFYAQNDDAAVSVYNGEGSSGINTTPTDITIYGRNWGNTQAYASTSLNQTITSLCQRIPYSSGTKIGSFSSSMATFSYSDFGVTVRPSVIVLTPQSQMTELRYDFDASTARIVIRNNNTASGNIRFCYFCRA